MLKNNSYCSSRFLMCIALLIFTGGCKTIPWSSGEDKQITIDSMNVTINDGKQKELRKNELISLKAEWDKLLHDSINIKSAAKNQVDNTLNETQNYLEKIISAKNATIFNLSRKLISETSTRPNVWLLIGIILITGLLGGLAGPKFYLLNDTKIETLDNLIETLKKEIAINKTEVVHNKSATGLEQWTHVANAIESSDKILTIATETAKELKKESEVKFAYLLFGLIAASLSFVALNLFESKILDFRNEIDYFIFAGYCLLGSVFAKKWISQLYDTISKKG